MGVSGINGTSGVTGVYGKKGNLKVNRAKSVESKKDVASISKSGKDFAVAMKAVREVPDIREEKVQEIKNKVEAGEYKVSAKDIAERLASKFYNRKA